MLKYVEDIVKGAFESGVNVPTFWFLNGCLVALIVLCLAVALLSGEEGDKNGVDMPLHFSIMGLLALGLGLSLNYVIAQAKVVTKASESAKKAD